MHKQIISCDNIPLDNTFMHRKLDYFISLLDKDMEIQSLVTLKT